MPQTITINQRFCGPPEIGNGGYVCGLLAKHINGPAQVTLRAPAPLEQPLTLEVLPEGQVSLKNGDALVAQARPAGIELELPTPPSYTQAQAASQHYPGFKEHPYPGCFVCGPNRAEADGLRIFPSPAAGQNMVIAPWLPNESLADETGLVRPEYLWAALDCPGGIAATANNMRPILLGQLTANIQNRPKPGQRCVVMGWTITQSGRKHTVGTALFSDSGSPYGYAQAIWIEPKSK